MPPACDQSSDRAEPPERIGPDMAIMLSMLKWTLCLLLCCWPGIALPTQEPEAPLVRLEIELAPQIGRLSGVARIEELRSTGGSAELALDRSATIEAVLLDGNPADFRFDQGRLTVKLSEPTRPLRLQISYTDSFRDRPPEIPRHDENPGYGVTATILPEGTFLSSAAAWYPVPDEPVRLDLSISAPAGYEAVTEGRRTGHQRLPDRTFSSWRTERPVTGLSLAAGPLEVFERPEGPVPVYAYFSAGSEALAEVYLKAAENYLGLYQELFGPYPFSKFAIVENFFPTGYGFPSWTLLGSSVIRMPFIVQTSLGHEIAHSWWGNGVLVDPSRGNWAEGLTTYVADYLYKERESAQAAREYRLKILRDYTTLAAGSGLALDRFSSRFDRASQAVGYGKCAMVFHMLRRHIGDKAFWEALRNLARNEMNRSVSWAGLEQAFSQAAGTPLGDWFRPWLERSDDPRIRLAEIGAERHSSGWTVHGRLEQLTPPFPLDLTLEVATAEGPVTRRFFDDQTDLEFSLNLDHPPLRLTVDPQYDLFRILDPVELPATVNHLRASQALTVFVADPAADQAPLRALLAALRQENAVVLPADRLDPDRPPPTDLLFYGHPPALPELDLPLGVDLTHQAITIAEAGCGSDCDNRLLVFFLRQNPARVAALFLPGGGSAALSVARKIPHYGNYSYLLFAGDAIRDKGTWTARRSPLVHFFKEIQDP